MKGGEGWFSTNAIKHKNLRKFSEAGVWNGFLKAVVGSRTPKFNSSWVFDLWFVIQSEGWFWMLRPRQIFIIPRIAPCAFKNEAKTVPSRPF